MGRGLLLVNLGSPEAPTRPAVARYLNEFLTDPYVIDIRSPWRQILVRGVITPLRASRSARAYRKIWTSQGSPLVNHTKDFARALAVECPDLAVRWSMRYGEPSVASAVRDWKVSDLMVVPMYPQYAESSTRTALEHVSNELRRAGFRGQVSVLEDFFAEPEFVSAVSASIDGAAVDFRPDHLLMSFHGLPEHHMTKIHPETCAFGACCDFVSERNRHCYRAQCHATARGVLDCLATNLSLPSSVSFQSRLGRRPWIKPYTDHVVSDLARRGVRRLLVASPSFVADCLETLEEIGMRLRSQFRSEGGEELRLVPALNSAPHWVESFAAMIKRPSLQWR